MKKFWKKAAAAVTAFALLGGALPVSFAGVQLLRPSLTAFAYQTVTYDAANKVLTLHGNVDKQEVRDFLKTNRELITVNCEEGTVFPEDCSCMFMGLIGEPKIIGISDGGAVYSDDPRDLDWFSFVREFDLRNADTSHVTNMECMFRGNFCCDSILMNFDTSHVENMSRMFSYCRDNLTVLDLSGFDMSNVTDASEMFYVCCNLITIYADSNWNVNPETTDCTEMFSYCTKLTGGNGTRYSSHHTDGEYARIDGVADAPGYLTRKKTYNTVSFDEETGVLTLHGLVDKEEVRDFMCNPCKVRSIVCEEGTVLPEDCSGLFAFEYRDNFIEEGPNDNGTWSTVYDYKYFDGENCTIDLSNADSSHVTNMSGMFQGNITSVNFGDFDTSHVTDMSFMFHNCPQLESLDLSSFDISNVQNMNAMFQNERYIDEQGYYVLLAMESHLKTIYVNSNWDLNTEEVDCTNMFWDCEKLVGGKGTEYSSDHVNGEYAHIDGGAENPGYLTFGGSTVKGASLSLDGRIGLNFYVRLNSDAAKAVLEGPLGTVEIPSSKFAGLTVQNGDYAGCTKLTYGINATQRLNKVTLKLYDSGNNLTDIYKGNAVPLTDKQFLYSAVDYIDSYQDTGNENLTNLVTALERYFKSAENHFMGKTHTIFPEGYSHRWFDDYNTADGDYGLSLILNSGTDLRIYTDAAEVIWQTDFDEYETLTAETSADGKRYFAITDIPAQNLVGSERIYVDGREHLVCPRDWCVLAVADDKPQTVQDLGWALYEYGKAAETYLHSL